MFTFLVDLKREASCAFVFYLPVLIFGVFSSSALKDKVL